MEIILKKMGIPKYKLIVSSIEDEKTNGLLKKEHFLSKKRISKAFKELKNW